MKIINTNSLVATILLSLIFTACCNNRKNNNEMATQDSKEINRTFPKGNQISNDYFSGTAWLQMLVAGKENFDLTIGNVTFEQGVRNNWHSHPGGQILLCTKGTGYYQEKGKPVQLLNVGDVIEIQPDVVHWHGATPDSEFEHIAINPQLHKGSVIWLEPVTDEEYKESSKRL
jgi:quercetin dioxygenase-like cupin family protein